MLTVLAPGPAESLPQKAQSSSTFPGDSGILASIRFTHTNSGQISNPPLKENSRVVLIGYKSAPGACAALASHASIWFIAMLLLSLGSFLHMGISLLTAWLHSDPKYAMVGPGDPVHCLLAGLLAGLPVLYTCRSTCLLKASIVPLEAAGNAQTP
jgi:hypothetical protein